MLRIVCFVFNSATEYFYNESFIDYMKESVDEEVDITNVFFINQTKRTREEINDHIVELVSEVEEYDLVYIKTRNPKTNYYFIDHFIKIGKRVFVWADNSIVEVNV